MTAPTPSQPDPDRPRRSHRYDSRRGRQGPAGDRGPQHRPGGSHEEGSGPPPYGGRHASDAGEHGAGEHEAVWPSHPGEDFDKPDLDVRSEVRTGFLTVLVVTVLGVGLGLLWLWLAPRVPLVTVDNSVFLKDPEGEEAVGADGTFVLLAVGFGLLTGALAFLRDREGGVGLVVGLGVGAVLGSVLAWRLGVWLGPESDLVAAAKAAGAGKTFDAPLKLQAKSALLVWPLLALVVHLVLIGMFGKREPEPGLEQFPPGGGRGGPHDW